MISLAAIDAGVPMDRFSIRITMPSVLLLGGTAVGLASRMSQLWRTTVPPTMTPCAELFGQRNVGTIAGFVAGAYQFGAALLAFLAGDVYYRAGGDTIAFVAAGCLGLIGGLIAVRIERPPP